MLLSTLRTIRPITYYPLLRTATLTQTRTFKNTWPKKPVQDPHPEIKPTTASSSGSATSGQEDGHVGDWFEDVSTYDDSEPILDMFRNAEMNSTEPHPGALFEDTGNEDLSSSTVSEGQSRDDAIKG
ncbi:hypothetical protein HK097_008801 [Rhizophlyctis rosea]|uniref:Uncharacterized protein n=1 Tax=Rhizophlyctis rosea TaxID=64517 RepID=A0AAD5X971_9FUNG|nr:hypothetical protein HK097_008801 [Rhizophlyctis rosea]